MGEPGRYLFAVTRGVDPASLRETHGLRGAPLDVVDDGGLQAVVCDVDLEEFGEDSLRRHLEDLPWVEEVARAHHDVVAAVSATSTVAPMRLVTICRDDDSVRARLQESGEALTAALDRVEGRREWSVKAYAVAADPQPTATPAGEESGAAYLRRKRDEAQRRRGAADRALADAERVHEALVAVVVASRRLGPQDPQLTGRHEPMTLNAAYLVDVEAGEKFRALVDEVASDAGAISVEVAGPWPPYSFTTLE